MQYIKMIFNIAFITLLFTACGEDVTDSNEEPNLRTNQHVFNKTYASEQDFTESYLMCAEKINLDCNSRDVIAPPEVMFAGEPPIGAGCRIGYAGLEEGLPLPTSNESLRIWRLIGYMDSLMHIYRSEYEDTRTEDEQREYLKSVYPEIDNFSTSAVFRLSATLNTGIISVEDIICEDDDDYIDILVNGEPSGYKTCSPKVKMEVLDKFLDFCVDYGATHLRKQDN